MTVIMMMLNCLTKIHIIKNQFKYQTFKIVGEKKLDK